MSIFVATIFLSPQKNIRKKVLKKILEKKAFFQYFFQGVKKQQICKKKDGRVIKNLN